MNFYISIVDLYLLPTFLFIGYFLIIKLKNFFEFNYFEINFIYFYHSLFTLIYFIFSIDNFNDSVYYFLNSKNEIYNFNFGTKFIQSIITLLVNFFEISLINLFYFFNILGSLAICLIYSSFKKIQLSQSQNKIILFIICFLPSLYFWSSSVGKESITYLAIGFLLSSFTKKKINYIFIMISFLLFLSVRPFMAGFLIISIFLGYLLKPNKYILPLFPLIISVPIIFLIYLNKYMKSLSYDFFYNLNSLMLFIKKRKSDTVFSNFTNMTEENFFYHIFSYLFRPLPFESFNPFYLLIGIENFILFIALIYCLINFKIKLIYQNNKISMLFFSIISGFFFIIATYNLGIAIRQKWFFLIPFFFTILSTIEKK